jgi:hypothetical protein
MVTMPIRGSTKLFPAAVLAMAHVQDPTLWTDRYIWSSDRDQNGDRVYLGKAAEYGGLQVHRHLTITDAWGVTT